MNPDNAWLEQYAKRHATNPRIASSLPAVSASRATTTPVGSVVKPALEQSVTIVIGGAYVPSNNIYASVTNPKTGREMRVKTSLARKWKETAMRIVAPFKACLQPALTYTLELDVYHNWFNLDSSVKVRDVGGAEKLTADAISEALGFDDSRFWKVTLEKYHDPLAPRIVARVCVRDPLPPQPPRQPNLFGREP